MSGGELSVITGEVPASPPNGAGQWTRLGEQKVSCRGCSIRAAGDDREPFADIFFRQDIFSCPTHTTVQLIMDQVDFGVRKSCARNCSATNQSCDENCKTFFIYKMSIAVQPRSWAHDCHRLLLYPFRTPQIFGLQRNFNLGFQIPLVDPRQAAVNYQIGSTISRAVPEFGWNPASRDNASSSVSWTWQLNRYASGRKLKFGDSRWGCRPSLPIQPNHTHIHPGSFLAQASWEVQPNAQLGQEHREWGVKVALHTAVLQCKGPLPRYSLTVGPTSTFEKLLAFPQASTKLKSCVIS